VGSAENTFVEDSWPIPVSLREHVLTVQLSSDPGVRACQQRILTAWTPTSQIETALPFVGSHRWCSEILDALDALGRRQDLKEYLKVVRSHRWWINEMRAQISVDFGI
jgi:hypothetical protein